MLQFLIQLLKLFSKKTEQKVEKIESTVKEEPIKEVVGMLHAKNNSPRLKKELIELQDKNKELHELVIDLYKWIAKEINKDTIITMIFRTDAEQDELYKHSDKYKNKPFKSPHQFWHAVDLRTSIYNDEEIEKIVKYLNDKYDSTNYYGWTAKAHAIKGNAMHFHINYVKK